MAFFVNCKIGDKTELVTFYLRHICFKMYGFQKAKTVGESMLDIIYHYALINDLTSCKT